MKLHIIPAMREESNTDVMPPERLHYEEPMRKDGINNLFFKK